jgi:hypothetical protein
MLISLLNAALFFLLMFVLVPLLAYSLHFHLFSRNHHTRESLHEGMPKGGT